MLLVCNPGWSTWCVPIAFGFLAALGMKKLAGFCTMLCKLEQYPAIEDPLSMPLAVVLQKLPSVTGPDPGAATIRLG